MALIERERAEADEMRRRIKTALSIHFEHVYRGPGRAPEAQCKCTACVMALALKGREPQDGADPRER
jgi:hypothetical protein